MTVTEPVHLIARDFDRASLVSLRHEVGTCVAAGGLRDPDLYRFLIAINEITTNAVQHGGGGGRLELWRSDHHLSCRVSDQGPGMPDGNAQPVALPPANAVHGRGLWLARTGSTTFTIDSGTCGTTVTLTHVVTDPPAG